jgi:hypothetical protein
MDPISELEALEASSLAGMTAVQPVEQTPALVPEAPPDGDVTLQVNSADQLQQIQQQQSAAPAAPDAPQSPTAPAAPTAAETPGAPAAPEVVVPTETPRRVYAHPGMTEDNKLLLKLIDANPGLSLEAITAAASVQLGRPIAAPATQPSAPPAAPGDSATPPPAPTEQTPTVDTVNARLDDIDAELATLDPVMDADRWKTLSIEASRLSRQLPLLIATKQQRQIEQQTLADQAIVAAQTQVAERYPQINGQVFDTAYDLTKPISGIVDPFAQAVAARIRRDVASNSPLLDAPDYELLVTAALAQEHGIAPTTRKATPPVQPATAAPHAQTAPAAPRQAGPAPLTVMPAVPGSQHTSADRVTTTPANPQADLNAQYQQAGAADDFAAIERLSGQMAAGPQAQFAMPPQIIGISVTATPGA